MATLHVLAHAAPRPANDRSSRDRTFSAVHIDTLPNIDGRLDEAVWQTAPADDRFTQNFPDEGAAPTERTELRVLYTNDTIVIGIRCWDQHADQIVERLTRRDRDTAADQVSIEISSKNDHVSAFHFAVNVAGVLSDGMRYADTEYSSDWDGAWKGATSRDAQGWSAEISIPVTDLRYEKQVTRFGLQVRRVIQRRQETDEWVYVPRTAAGEVSQYGALEFPNQLRPRRLIRFGAYAAGRLLFISNQAPLPFFNYDFNFGADLKIALTPSLIVDATVNPDFGQVEADPVVLNLTTFEIYYPEKRPLFIEGSDVFVTPFQQYYSRRIGMLPASPMLDAGDALAAPLPTGRIWAALKLSGLVGKRTSIGVVDALTAEQDVQVLHANGQRESLAFAPLTNFGILRLKREFGAYSHFGFMATATTRSAAVPNAAAMNRCLDGVSPDHGRCTHDAYTVGTDLSLKSRDAVWGAFANAVASALVGGPARPQPDGTSLQSGDIGYGINAEIGRYGGRYWRARLAYLAASRTLDLNDAGYLEQANLHQALLDVSLRRTRPLGLIQESSLGMQLTYAASWDGAQLTRRGELISDTLFKSLWELYLRVRYDLPHDDNREARDGTITQRPGGWEVGLYLRSNPQRRFFFDVGGGVSQRLRGLASDAFTTLSFRMTSRLELDLIPSATWSFGDPRWFATETNADGTRTYYFGDLDSRSLSVTLRATYTFLPTLSLQAYAQLFVAGGHYGPVESTTVRGPRPTLQLGAFSRASAPDGSSPDFREGSLNVNVVLRWEYAIGSTLLLVYTRAHQQSTYDPTEGGGMPRFAAFKNGPAVDVLLLKVNYQWN